MKKIKDIKFDYGRIYTYKLESEGSKVKKDLKPLKLEKILELALTKTIKERTAPYYGEDVILQTIDKLDNGLWKLQFIKQRSAEVPGIIDKKTDEFKKLELDESEYVGEDIAVIYQEKTNVLMVQRNRTAIGINGLKVYFQKILNSDQLVDIRLVPITNKLSELEKLIIRKIEVSFSDAKYENEESPLIGFITSANKMKSLSTKISLSVGHSKKNQSLTKEELEELSKLREEDGFNKVHIEYKEYEDAPIEQVEFINGSLFDHEKFEFSKKNEINYKRIVERMIDIFKTRKDYLEKIYV